ncbi:hypothetical protein DM02DRAFT_655789 [Periconia macrospinosa]|uniref:Uncharacterized protein n=1 Tax=Periconia macrospinosa TaxID=97972 RepID=A0A2V1DRU2_9PLEO|nr:hypothetical protein DM02DRAFT_655789 [Periconia macrospinosa]
MALPFTTYTIKDVADILLAAEEVVQQSTERHAPLTRCFAANIRTALDLCEKVEKGESSRTPRNVLNVAIARESCLVAEWNKRSPEFVAPFPRDSENLALDALRRHEDYPARVAAELEEMDYDIPKFLVNYPRFRENSSNLGERASIPPLSPGRSRSRSASPADSERAQKRRKPSHTG